MPLNNEKYELIDSETKDSVSALDLKWSYCSGKKCELVIIIESNFKLVDKINNNVIYLKISH